jgi:hypothetical protein
MMRRIFLALVLCFTTLPALAQSITLLALEPGVVGQSTPGTAPFQYYGLTGYGTYVGTAPSSATATWTGCTGGGKIFGFGVNAYPVTTFPGQTGTFAIQVSVPDTAGTCTLHITTNLGTTSSHSTTIAANTHGPLVTANIHNAPGWLPSHAYTPASGPKTRVNNGAGWTPGTTTWNPGLALKAYELTSGSCTSASSGGPSGTGSSITDGTCTWKYLSDTDYVSFTGWSRDSPVWVSGTTYTFGQQVTTNIGGINRAYSLTSSGGDNFYPFAFCTSTAAPSGVGTTGNSFSSGWFVAADGCTWSYMGDILYSSRVASIPYMTYSPTGYGGSTPAGPREIGHMFNPFKALLWNDQEYHAGNNGELGLLLITDHQGDGHIGAESSFTACTGPSFWKDCPTITIEPAPGEGLTTGFTPTTPLTGYDVSKGVGLKNTGTSWPGIDNASQGLAAFDFNLIINGLQIKSTVGDGLDVFNNVTVLNCIIDGGFPSVGKASGMWGDVPVLTANNLILSHGWNGLALKYGSTVSLFNTIVNLGSTPNAVGLTYQWAWTWVQLIAANNAIYGFPHAAAFNTSEGTQTLDPSSKSNVTDTVGPDSGNAVPIAGTGTAAGTVMILPNSTYNASSSAMFVSPGSDWRPGPALIGAGASYGTFGWGCALQYAPACIPKSVNEDTPDIIGTPRPTAGSWTVGAFQSPTSGPLRPSKPGLRLRPKSPKN